MRRLSIARSVQVALLGLTLALTVIAGLGVSALYASRQDYEDRLSAALAVQAGAARLLAAGVVEEATLRLTPQDLPAAARARAAYDRGLADVGDEAADDPRSAALVQDAGRAQARLRAAPGRLGAPLAARRPLAQLSARQDLRVMAARDDAARAARRSLLAIVVGGGLALLAALGLVAGLVAGVRRPLDALVGAAGRLAAGEHGARVPEQDGPRELRQLAQAFNAMADDVESAGARVETERRRLATSVRALGDALVTEGPDGRVTQANPRAAELTPELQPGRPFEEPATLADALAGEVEVERGGRTLSITAAALDDGGHVWTIRDVTARARLERLKSDFVATASHELRSPLTSIKGFVELLGASRGLTDRQREWVGIIHVSTDRLVELVNDLLDVTRLEAGQVRIHRRPTDVRRLATEVGELLSPRLAAKGQSFAVEAPPDLPRAVVDPGRLRQVLVNLLTNAHLYTGQGGRLAVELEAQDGALVVRVSDTGAGMDAAALAHVFDRFYRGAERDGPQGTGLGLSIVRSLVDLHRGTVTVASRPGEGTTFTVRLPRALERRATAPGEAVRQALDGKHVLAVVADAEAVGRALAPFGATVEAAVPERAVPTLRARRFDAAVVDLTTGGAGFELQRGLRGDPELRRLPLLLVARAAVHDALGGEWVVEPGAGPEALADALGAAIASARIRVLAVGGGEVRGALDEHLDELGIAHEWATDADDAAAMCASRHYEVALVDAGLEAPDEVVAALDLRGRRLRRAVLAFAADGAAPAAAPEDADPVAVADAGAAVLGLLAPTPAAG